MDTIPVPQVSEVALRWFLGLVGALALLLPWATVRARPPGEGARTSALWCGLAAGVVALWLGASAFVASSGALRDLGGAPALLVFLGLVTAATTLLAFSPLGSRLATGLGMAGLVGKTPPVE